MGVALALASARFGYAYEVADMPVLCLVAGLVLAGALYALFLPPLIRNALTGDVAAMRRIMVCIVAAGLVARLVLFLSQPILEDDYQRYLWDGAVTANRTSPYAVSPKDALQRGDQDALGRLAREGAPVVGRINHADLRTVYPPVAQGAFALAYLLKPWSLLAWRSVILACDLTSLILILLLLRECGRSPLWSALYWWNPIVIKELFNSAHMEAVVLPLVLAALLFATRRRYIAAVATLGLAAGAKIWPALLLPLLVRPLTFDRRKLVGSLALFGGMLALWAAPVVRHGFDEQSGFAAYFTSWQTNSAHLPALESGIDAALELIGLQEPPAGLLARMVLTVVLGGLMLAVSIRPLEGSTDLINRASIAVAALVLLAPAQYPWYYVWFAPFLPFKPWPGFLLLAATIPLYYTSFSSPREQTEVFEDIVVWIIWAPVWATLVVEALRRHRRERPVQGHR